MQKKGFTLVELLGVIVLLAIVMLIATRSIVGIRNNSLQKILETKVSEIKQAAIIYGQETPFIFTNPDKKDCTGEYAEYSFCTIVTVKELIDANFYDTQEENSEGNKDLINNVTGESMLDDEIIIYRKNNRIYSHMDKYDTN